MLTVSRKVQWEIPRHRYTYPIYTFVMPLLVPARQYELKWRLILQAGASVRQSVTDLLHSRPAIIPSLWVISLICITTGELLPGNSRPITAFDSLNVSDKLLHLVAYALLALIPTFGFRLRTAGLFLLASELVGVALEFAQFLIPQRSGDPIDVGANTLGLLLGAVVGRVLRVRMQATPYTPVHGWERHKLAGGQSLKRSVTGRADVICHDVESNDPRV